jgi:hypothetical protein
MIQASREEKPTTPALPPLTLLSPARGERLGEGESTCGVFAAFAD